MTPFTCFNTEWTAAMEGGRLIDEKAPYMWYDREQVWIGEKTVALTIENKPNIIHHWDGNTYNPTIACGLMRSVDTFSYGIFSAEIQLPKGRNLWPSFWLVGEGEWPANGEIDIVEAWTDKRGRYFRFGIPQPPFVTPSWDVTTNVHWNDEYREYWNYDGHRSTGSRRLPLCKCLKNPSDGFHRYEVVWLPDSITFRIDGKKLRSHPLHIAKHIEGTKQHVIFDLWTTTSDCSMEQPMYIRTFEYKPIEIL